MSIWNKILGRNGKDFFLEFSPEGSNWRVVTWNLDLSSPDKRRWTIEIRGEKEKRIHWERSQIDEVYIFENNRLKNKTKIKQKDTEVMALMNLAIHSTLKFSIHAYHDFILAPVSGATALDYQNEGKALQWIQTSFLTLTKALDSLAENTDRILTAACFSEIVPDTGEDLLRVMVFNLDIFFYLRSDKSLHIIVFNDKNLGQGSSETPTFQQIIKVTKPLFYDEITKLINRIAQVGEIN